MEWVSESALLAHTPAYPCLAATITLGLVSFCATALTILSPVRNGWEVELVALAEGGVGGAFS